MDDDIKETLRTFGGIVLKIADGTWIIPNVRTDYNELRVEYEETNFEYMRFEYKALAKLRVYSQEHYHTIFFEPVAPADIGLTGKYQNTLSEAEAERHVIRIGKD